MKHKFAIYGRLNEWLFDIMAHSREEAVALAMLDSPYACRAELVKPGNDLGCDGI